MLNQIENLEKLVIAAINGYALGAGCEIALACDIQIASGNAKIGQTEVKIGIPHGWGGTQRMLRESYFVYPPILCIRFMVGLSSLAPGLTDCTASAFLLIRNDSARTKCL